MVKIPSTLTAGVLLAPCVADDGFSAVNAYLVGPARHVLALTVENDVWSGSIDTYTWIPGAYSFELWADLSSGGRKLLEKGVCKVSPSLISGDVTELDPRSIAQIIVENIEAFIAGTASKGVKSYKINNRELDRYSLVELTEILNIYRARWKAETRLACGGSPFGGRIVFNF